MAAMANEVAAAPRDTEEPLERGAEADLAWIRAAARDVARRLAEKRRARDVVWVLCLDDKLSQLHATYRMASESREALHLALERSDAGQALRERARVAVQRARADMLLWESRQCVSQCM
jgi:hypothetical protein